MYKFTDPGEPASEEYLPSEAVFIDGTCIDQEIDGYQTLTVSGREPVNMDYSERKIGNNLYLEDYYQTSRIIEVQYHLQADTPEELVQKFDKLNGLLDFKETKVQFADDLEHYYIGSKTEAEAPPVGVLSCVSTFQIYCPDSHKYSVVEKEFIAKPNASGVLEATIYNNGTATVPIDYTIHNNHDNGYVGIVTPDTVLQIGRIAEVDEVPYQQSEILIFTNDFSNWDRDTGKNIQDPSKLTNGSLTTSVIGGRNCLRINDAGTGANAHGGMVTIDIPPDSEGNAGATNFYCYFNAWFETGRADQVGTMGLNFLDENDHLIFSYIIEKRTKESNIARVTMSAGRDGEQQQYYWKHEFPPTMYEKDNPTNEGRGHNDILKEGDTVSAHYWGARHEITLPELATMKCKRVQVYIGQYGTSPQVTRMYLREFRFQKNYVEKWKDVPNRYPKGSTIEIDGGEGKIYTDGVLRMDDEVHGSHYPLAPPGESKVQFYCSDFADPKPNITARIREGWL